MKVEIIRVRIGGWALRRGDQWFSGAPGWQEYSGVVWTRVVAEAFVFNRLADAEAVQSELSK